MISDICLNTRNAEEALKSLNQITIYLSNSNDFRVHFCDIYRLVTENVVKALDNDFFKQLKFIDALAPNFCNRYLQTLDWSINNYPQDCLAWKTAYSKSYSPLQNALLGLNAHINYDLAIGIYQVLLQFDYHDINLLSQYKSDHDRVNLILNNSIYTTFDILSRRYNCYRAAFVMNNIYYPVAKLSLFVLKFWRERVWLDALLLLQSHQNIQQQQRVLQQMNSYSNFWAKIIAYF